MLEDNLSFRILAGVTYTTEEIKMTIKAKTGSKVWIPKISFHMAN